MALPVIPEDEFDLTPYLQEGAESSLLLCGLLTIGKTEYAPFILFPTEESISAGPKAKTLDGWKMMTSTPSNISQRFVTIGGQQISICSPENADMNPRGLLVVGSNKKARIGLQRIITNHYSFRDSVTPLPHAAAAEVPSWDACKSFPERVSYPQGRYSIRTTAPCFLGPATTHTWTSSSRMDSLGPSTTLWTRNRPTRPTTTRGHAACSHPSRPAGRTYLPPCSDD